MMFGLENWPKGVTGSHLDSPPRINMTPSESDSKEFEHEDFGADPKIIFKERWAAKQKRIRANSVIGHLEGWRLVPVILKSNDDLRQEQICSHLIALMNDIIVDSGLNCYLRPYDIMALSPDSGVIEAIPDTISLDCLKKRDSRYTTLRAFYMRYFGAPSSRLSFERARENFIRSMAPYSIICYLLQIKDRHNGNILIDAEGRVIHIDFGFILGSLLHLHLQNGLLKTVQVIHLGVT